MIKRSISIVLMILILPVGLSLAQPEVINSALADLSERLGTSLTLDQLAEWTWGEDVFEDSSLGCPQPDQNYAQVVTRGYTFTFTVDGNTYDYRADAAGNFFLCSITAIATTTPPPEPTPTLATPSEAVITPENAEAVFELARVEDELGAFGRTITWTPVGDIIAVAGDLNAEAATGGSILLFNANDLRGEPERIELNTVLTAIDSWAVEDQAYLVAGMQTGEVAIFPAETNSEPLLMQAIEGVGQVNSIAISVDGVFIAAGYSVLDAAGGVSVNLAQVWDATTGAPLRTFQHNQAVGAVAFSPESALLATGDAAGFVRLWDVLDGTLSLETQVSGGAIRDLAFSPDGTLLAIGGESGITRLMSTESQTLAGELDNTTGNFVFGLAFSPDGLLLATAGGNPDTPIRDNSIRLWDVAALDVVGGLPGHDELVGGIAFSPDGTRIASVSLDGTLRIWGVAESAVG